ncbi:MAG: acyl-CoA reductase [Candidatus Micrarchaeia archaeon]|jgi:hypothetical protein
MEILMLEGKILEPARASEGFSKEFPKLIAASEKLQQYPIEDLCAFFEEYGKNIARDGRTRNIPGAAFASIWLKKSNLLEIVSAAIGTPLVLRGFVEHGGKMVKAQPRGLAVHWLAGNVETLPVFSLVQSVLAGNANILRLPSATKGENLALLQVLAETRTGKVDGAEVSRSIAAVSVPKEDAEANAMLSSAADVRVVWGGREAVLAITGMPKSETCEDLVFGPKYSFSVIDGETQKSAGFESVLQNLASDVSAFDQSACSSPHTVFLEEGGIELEKAAEMLAKKLEATTKGKSPGGLDAGVASKIMSLRAQYSFAKGCKAVFPPDMRWTVLAGGKAELEAPCQFRTVFVKKAKTLGEAAGLATRNTQTIGCAIMDEKNLARFADQASRRGAARITKIGAMNFYETPWDGMFPLQRLVRFCSYSKSIASK